MLLAIRAVLNNFLPLGCLVWHCQCLQLIVLQLRCANETEASICLHILFLQDIPERVQRVPRLEHATQLSQVARLVEQ